MKKSLNWHKKNPEKSKQSHAKWLGSHKETVLFYFRERTRQARKSVLLAYGGATPSCKCCQESTLEMLTVDHVDGGGSEHRKKVGKGTNFYRWLIKEGFPPGYQILCWNCNLAKGVYGVCAHVASRDMSTLRQNRLDALLHYGGNPPKCKRCGEENWQFLALDHKNNDGKSQREKLGVGNKYYAWIRNNGFPDIFQVLCHNCNSTKGSLWQES